MSIFSAEEDDEGFSLIELIVAMVLTGILSGVIVMILVNSWRTQENVVSETEGTNSGQVMSSGIERAIRNSVAIEVSDGGTVLKVHTTLGGAFTCQGFVLSVGESRWTTSANALGAPLGWPVWKEGILQQGSRPFFANAAETVSYAFDVDTDGAPVRFAGEASARSISGGSSPCW